MHKGIVKSQEGRKARSKQAGSQSKVKPNMLKCGQNQEQEQDFHPAKAGRGDGGRVLDANDAAVQYAAAGNIKIS